MITADDIPDDPDKAITEIVRRITTLRLDSNDIARLLSFLSLAAQHAGVSRNLLITIRGLQARRIHDGAFEIPTLRADLVRIEEKIQLDRLTRKFEAARKPAPTPVFELSDDEVAQIVEKTGEMRSIVTRSAFFSVDHKRRLLGRIAQIEAEIHKPKGNFDVILGGVVDVGNALGEFGDKVKPLVDRMREIQSIVQPKSQDYLGLPLPSEVKRLPAPKKKQQEDGSSEG